MAYTSGTVSDFFIFFVELTCKHIRSSCIETVTNLNY